ncbi:MAG: hypoxanthine phosphoribosyltransferase [Coriobacteriales bacterium]|jgi:hypoxanthine phosphoribosyltransferase
MNPGDIKKILYTADDLAKVVDGIAARINADYAGERLLVVAILKGSSVFMADLIRKLDVDVDIDFMIVSSYGSAAQSSGKVDIKCDLRTDIAGRHVLLIEDIIDTGLTLSKLAEELETRNPASVEIAALMIKDIEREHEIEPKYVGLVCPDEFVVGYGLDYNEMYRQLPYVGVLDEKVYS